MPDWLLPLLALIGLVSFLYFAFWKGLSNKPDPNNRDDPTNWSAGGNP
jgi:hypothetical protein